VDTRTTCAGIDVLFGTVHVRYVNSRGLRYYMFYVNVMTTNKYC